MTATDLAVPAPVPARATVPPPSRLSAGWRAVKVVCQRELIRFRTDKIRLVSSLAQPVLFLFVLGSGLSGRGGGLAGTDVDYQTFLFPGALSMSVLFTAMFSAMSIVWDREFGFLREMLVAPVPRSAIVVGKALGGSLVASFQGAVILALAGLAGVPYDPLMLVLLFVQLFLLAFAVSGFGLVIAARIKEMQAFMGIMNLVVMPLFFLSGALYPLGNLPGWLQVVARFNPLTYAVSAMRSTVFAALDGAPADLAGRVGSELTWFGWTVPVGVEVLAVVVLGAALVTGAVAAFRRAE
ncbi:MAG: ABC transporter permease [Acidimicrobiia bacterium]